MTSSRTGPWTADAACAALPPDLFFPDDGHPGLAATRAALSAGRGCPVRRPCLQAALDDRHVEGVWGGTTAAQRAELVRSRHSQVTHSRGPAIGQPRTAAWAASGTTDPRS